MDLVGSSVKEQNGYNLYFGVETLIILFLILVSLTEPLCRYFLIQTDKCNVILPSEISVSGNQAKKSLIVTTY